MRGWDFGTGRWTENGGAGHFEIEWKDRKRCEAGISEWGVGPKTVGRDILGLGGRTGDGARLGFWNERWTENGGA